MRYAAFPVASYGLLNRSTAAQQHLFLTFLGHLVTVFIF
jgi:hypothetical protein